MNQKMRTNDNIHSHVFFLGARRLSRSDWDPARAESEAKAQSAVWNQTLAWSRLGRKRSLASLIGGAQSDECQNPVNYKESDPNRAPVQAW